MIEISSCSVTNEPPSLSIIVVVHRAIEATLNCLSSIEKTTYDNMDVIVVINDGLDSSYNKVKAFLVSSKKKYFIYRVKNNGFAHACNYGVYHSNSDYIWLLNSDCIIPENAPSEMLKSISPGEKVIVGSILTKPDGLIQCIGGGALNFKLGTQKQLGYNLSVAELSDDKVEKMINKIDFITGASLLISRSNYLYLEGMDESFFMYWEETEFCYRAKLQGYRFDVCKDIKVFHEVGASTGITSDFTEYYSSRNAILFYSKYSGRINTFSISFINFFAKLINRVRRRNLTKIKVVFSAILDGFYEKSGRHIDY